MPTDGPLARDIIAIRVCHEPVLKVADHFGLGGRDAAHMNADQEGSVAQIARDSLRDSKVLVGFHEQTHTPDLPHDELALL